MSSSMDVVEDEDKSKPKQPESEQLSASELNAIDGEDLLWSEILKTLDKLEKGVEGDLSALGRAVRNINRFRKRLPFTTWLRILHTIIPSNYKDEFNNLLKQFITDKHSEEIKLISKLAAVSIDDATQKLKSKNDDVFATLMEFVAEKEKLAKIEIKKKQKQLKQERLARENKKKKSSEDDESEKEAKKSSEDVMEVDSESKDATDSKMDASEIETVKITLLPLKDLDNGMRRKFYPETYIFFQLLIACEFMDRKQYKSALPILSALIEFVKTSNRRSSDLLSSRCYQFFMLCHLRIHGNANSDLRNFLFDEYQSACLQQNNASQSVLIVLILQCFVDANLYSLAAKFVQKAEFWEGAESQIAARYDYYRGCIECVALNYSNSLFYMEQAIRRAPQSGAHGFKVSATRWLICIALLMGDIPDTAIFNPRFDQISFADAMRPFLQITECVKEGQLGEYEQCLADNAQLFAACGLDKILLRLRHNVIKTGLRKINKAYSRISLADIASKLGLDSQSNAYFIVSKAIRDGVIGAKIDFNEKYVQSTRDVDVYRTAQPYADYAQRIKFCLEIRNNAVKSLRYPKAASDDDSDEERKKKQKDNDDFVTPEEIADIIQKHFEEEEDEQD